MTSTLRVLGVLVLGVAASGCAAGSAGRGSGSPGFGPQGWQGARQGAPLQVAHLYLPGWRQAAPVYYENRGGMAVTEGDIMLGPVHELGQAYGGPRLSYGGAFHAVASDNESHLWPGGVIPYEIDSSVTATRRGYIDWAVNHVSTTSVLSMRPRTPADEDYVTFTEAADGYGCWSWIGRKGGSQEIRVSDCENAGLLVHEIGHAAGFYHEQQRSDRDAFITVMWDEIEPSRREWFEVASNAVDVGPYDYASIMHYGRKSWSARGADTIVPKDPNAHIGQQEGLSDGDRAALAQLYRGGVKGPSLPGTGSTPGGIDWTKIFPGGVPPLPQGLPAGWPPTFPGLPATLPAIPIPPGLSIPGVL